MQYRIFTVDPGKHQDASQYVFIAAFPDQQTAADYTRYLFGKPKARGKTIIIKRIEECSVDVSEGAIDGMITALGEVIPSDELS